MTDKITDERLREIHMHTVTFDTVRAIADELLAARQKIRADEEHLPTIASLTRDLHEAEQELATARADLREAMELLDMAEAPPDHENGGDLELWNRRRAVLRGVVEKRKETP